MDIYEVEEYEQDNDGVYSGYGDSDYASFEFYNDDEGNLRVTVMHGDHIDYTDEDEEDDWDCEDLEDMDFELVADKRTHC